MPRFRKKLAGAAAAAALCLLGAGTASTTPASAASSLEWAALGDSYTAGAIHAAGPFEQPRDGCQRTTEAYPEVIRRDLGSLVSLKNVSCGNATIADVDHRAQEPIGNELHIPGLIDHHDPDYPFPPVPPQIDALSPGTDLVTVGVGGNSLGFGEILGKCVALGPTGGVGSHPCEDYYKSGETESLEHRLERVRTEYDRMLSAIHAKSPFAKVITVGYPTVIPDNTAECTYGNLLQFATIRRPDLDWLRTSALEPLNAVIRHVSAAHGDRYVDIYDSSKGHSVCAGQEKWVEGIKERLFNDQNPDTWALVHPNVRGQANAAAQVEDAVLGG